jgi:hypothetical protein
MLNQTSGKKEKKNICFHVERIRKLGQKETTENRIPKLYMSPEVQCLCPLPSLQTAGTTHTFFQLTKTYIPFNVNTF